MGYGSDDAANGLFGVGLRFAYILVYVERGELKQRLNAGQKLRVT